MQTSLKKSRAAQQGIALIVILGLLAMLVILAVSFSISMRVERLASNSQVEYVKAKNLAWVGLTRAIGEVESEMLQSHNSIYYGKGAISADPNTPGSGTPGGSDWPRMGWIVNPFRPNTPGVSGTGFGIGTFGQYGNWISVVDPNNPTKLLGQYAYLMVDCSGYLDVNTIGKTNQGNRTYGTSPFEIALPWDVAKYYSANFTQERDYHRVESVNELGFRLGPFLDPTLKSNSATMVTFSWFPNDMYSQWGYRNPRPRTCISNATSIAQAKNTIINFFGPYPGAGIADANPQAFYDNLYDMVNHPAGQEDKPTNPNEMGGGKLVPMLYEVIVTNGVQNVGSKATAYALDTVSVIVETWFPFPIPATKAYQVVLSAPPTITPVAAPVPAKPLTWTPQTPVTPISFTPTAGFPVGGFNISTFTYIYKYPTNVTSVATTVTLPPNIYVKNNSGGYYVDQMPLPSTATPFTFTAKSSTAPAAKGWGVNDPRINYRPTDWVANKTANLTAANVHTLLNQTNDVCNTLGTDKNGDISTFMYTYPNATNTLQNIGDLGFLLYDPDKPWHTIRLFSPDPDTTARIFDAFTCQPTNQVFQGLVNPNNIEDDRYSARNILACIFNQASMARYPEEIPSYISADQALSVAALIYRYGPAYKQYDIENVFTNISDICRVTAADYGGQQGLDNIFPAPQYDYWQRKAVMRNAINLFSPRQNLWVIGIAGRTIKLAPGHQVSGGSYTFQAGDVETAYAPAVTLVWRDAYEDPTDTANPPGRRRHKSFIQYFQWQ